MGLLDTECGSTHNAKSSSPHHNLMVAHACTHMFASCWSRNTPHVCINKRPLFMLSGLPAGSQFHNKHTVNGINSIFSSNNQIVKGFYLASIHMCVSVVQSGKPPGFLLQIQVCNAKNWEWYTAFYFLCRNTL